MKTIYELALLYHPDLEIDLDKVNAKIEKLVTDNGGGIKDQDVWGKRRLAYPINGLEKAIYVFYNIELDGQASISKLESNLNIYDEVLRHLITKPDFKAIDRAKQFKSQRKTNQDETQEKDKSQSTEAKEADSEKEE